MKNTIKKAIISAALSLGVVGAISLVPNTASAQEYYVGDVPAYYVAGTEPVYYNGRAHYWYNNHWVYRDGGRWRYYNSEPGYFHDYRSRYPNGRWYYHHR